MHELSIAYSLIETASAALRDADVAKDQQVQTVHLRLGTLSGVVKSALLYCFDIAAEGTPLEGARLAIEELPVMVHCPRCEEDVVLPSVQSFRCPQCDTPTSQIVQGREMELTSLEVVDGSGK